MLRRSSSRFAMIGLAAALLAFPALTPTPANAAVPSSIQFVDTTTVTAGFGGDWTLVALAAVQYDGSVTVVPDPTIGTVTVLVSGVGGEFSSNLPVQPDGRVYITQPLDKPLLPAGDYDVTAIFVPAPGSFFATSQTATPAHLTITALEAQPRVEVVNDAAVSAFPIITAHLEGDYVESRGGAPAGTWSFVTEDKNGNEVYTIEVAQIEGDTEPVRVEIDTTLPRGSDFTVTSTFTVVDEYKGGVTVGEIPHSTFSTPGTTLLDSLASRVAFPGWLVVSLGVFLAALIASVVVLGVKLSRRADKAEGTTVSADEPAHVTEDVEMEHFGITPIRPATWSLSEDDAPTEALNGGAAREVLETPTDGNNTTAP